MERAMAAKAAAAPTVFIRVFMGPFRGFLEDFWRLWAAPGAPCVVSLRRSINVDRYRTDIESGRVTPRHAARKRKHSRHGRPKRAGRRLRPGRGRAPVAP